MMRRLPIFFLGSFVGVVLSVCLAPSFEEWRHSRRIERYATWLRGGGEQEEFLEDPVAALAYFEERGDIVHLDAVFPSPLSVRRDVLSVWSEFFLTNSAVVCSYANHRSWADIRGVEPQFHLNIWFRKDGEAAVVELIKNMHALSTSIED